MIIILLTNIAVSSFVTYAGKGFVGNTHFLLRNNNKDFKTNIMILVKLSEMLLIRCDLVKNERKQIVIRNCLYKKGYVVESKLSINNIYKCLQILIYQKYN